jgi:hypothetical protein
VAVTRRGPNVPRVLSSRKATIAVRFYPLPAPRMDGWIGETSGADAKSAIHNAVVRRRWCAQGAANNCGSTWARPNVAIQRAA